MAVDEFDEELRDIKREIIESRGLIIKTNNLTNALAADMKSIGKRQQGSERRAFWNSAAANLLFVVVVLGVVKVAWDFRAESDQRDLKRARAEVARLNDERDVSSAAANERGRAESAAVAFYELVRAGKKKEIVDGFEKLQKEKLTAAERAFFSDEVQRAKSQLAVTAYHAGLDHLRLGRWPEAVASLHESLRYDDTGTQAPAARLSLAQGLRRLNRQSEAIPILVKLSEASADPEILDDAAYLLAECLVDIQAYNDAKNALRTFVRRYPQSPFYNDARMTLADLEAKH